MTTTPAQSADVRPPTMIVSEFLSALSLHARLLEFERRRPMSRAGFDRSAAIVRELATAGPESIAWSPRASQEAAARRRRLRLLAALPGINELQGPEQVGHQLAGVLGRLWPDEVAIHAMRGWSSEPSCESLQAIGRHLLAGGLHTHIAAELRVSRDAAATIAAFLGVSETRAEDDLNIARRAIEQGLTKMQTRKATGWGNSKWSRVMREARAALAPSDQVVPA